MYTVCSWRCRYILYNEKQLAVCVIVRMKILLHLYCACFCVLSLPCRVAFFFSCLSLSSLCLVLSRTMAGMDTDTHTLRHRPERGLSLKRRAIRTIMSTARTVHTTTTITTRSRRKYQSIASCFNTFGITVQYIGVFFCFLFLFLRSVK